jgi:hypothetical protein
MRNLKKEVLEEFSEVQGTSLKDLTQGYGPAIAHDRAKRRWREENKDLQRAYTARHYARKHGKPLPPITRGLVKVEIFWEGQSFWYAKPQSSIRLGGPFSTMHEAWRHANKNRREVMEVLKTRGNREAQ